MNGLSQREEYSKCDINIGSSFRPMGRYCSVAREKQILRNAPSELARVVPVLKLPSIYSRIAYSPSHIIQISIRRGVRFHVVVFMPLGPGDVFDEVLNEGGAGCGAGFSRA